MNPVIALQYLLSGHLALAAIANGLLQLREAGTVDKRVGMRQVRRAENRHSLAFWPVTGNAECREGLLARDRVSFGTFGQLPGVQLGQHVGRYITHTLDRKSVV